MARDGCTGPPRRIGDIDIYRVYEVVCDQHGVISAVKRYEHAVRDRRDHWEACHAR